MFKQYKSFILSAGLALGIFSTSPAFSEETEPTSLSETTDEIQPTPDTTPDVSTTAPVEAVTDTNESPEATPETPSETPEMPVYVPEEVQNAQAADDTVSEDPLNPEETQATLTTIGADTTNVNVDTDTAAENLIDRLKPFRKGDKELAIGLGGSGYTDGFSFIASAVFAYYVINRLAPGLHIDYQATFGDVDYPQQLTIFPFVKFVLLRSARIAPYLLAGAGRTMAWAGADPELNTSTGEFYGYEAVSSWTLGMGGGVMIGLGKRARLQIELLAIHSIYDSDVWKDTPGIESTISWIDGVPTRTYRLTGERTKKLWYPAPSIWFSFIL